jgi:hypothetical protein
MSILSATAGAINYHKTGLESCKETEGIGLFIILVDGYFKISYSLFGTLKYK